MKLQYLVEIKDQIKLAHISEKAIEHLDEEMDGLQVSQLVVVRIHADAEEEPGVAPVDDFEGSELDKVGLVLLITGSNEAVDLFSFLSRERSVNPFPPDYLTRIMQGKGRGGATMPTSPLSFTFSSSCGRNQF